MPSLIHGKTFYKKLSQNPLQMNDIPEINKRGPKIKFKKQEIITECIKISTGIPNDFMKRENHETRAYDFQLTRSRCQIAKTLGCSTTTIRTNEPPWIKPPDIQCGHCGICLVINQKDKYVQRATKGIYSCKKHGSITERQLKQMVKKHNEEIRSKHKKKLKENRKNKRYSGRKRKRGEQDDELNSLVKERNEGVK